MDLGELFRPSLVDQSDTVGLEFQGKEYRFGEIADRARRLAGQLTLPAGERVAVYLKNCVELIEIYLASVKAGWIFTPINVLYKEREIRHILEDAEPACIFTSTEEAAAVWAVATCPVRLVEEMAPDRPGSGPALDTDSIACLIYTSGTTGKPKGAMLTHGNLIANTQSLIDAWRLVPEDRLLLPLPLFHVHGLGNGLHTWLALGYRMRLLDRFRKETIVDELLDFRPTVFFGVPAMYERLLDTPAKAARDIGRHARLFVSGSAPLAPATHKRFHELFGHVILERYGMSETLMNVSNPYDGERRPGSVGFPLPGVSIRVVNPATGEPCVDGEAGEVQIKGANVFPGYWRRNDATAEAFTEDGYFRSGDLGMRSADGYYTLQGRMRELIISSGFNVYPREVEEFLLEQPGVREAAVVGTPHPVKGEVPAAFIVMAEGTSLDADALTQCCQESLASFKVPVRFEQVEELPRNALGKIQKHLL